MTRWKATAAALLGRPALQDRSRELITRHVRGRSFADVGTMWNVHGAYAFHALASGASSVVAVDVMPATPEFETTNAATGGRVRFVNGDINDRATTDAIGQADVVFCAGVLYHVPDPVLTLRQLRRVCGSVLILASSTIPEQAHPQAAVFLPFLDAASRRALTFTTPHAKIGLDTGFAPDQRYENWFWGFSPSCVAAMVRAAAFDVLETYPYRRAVCLVCRPVEASGQRPGG